jgi:hypothetical protein
MMVLKEYVMSIAVEKNVPLPKLRTRNIYPYEQMEVGDSFFLENAHMPTVSNNNNQRGKKLGMKFIARKEGNGARIWRIE